METLLGLWLIINAISTYVIAIASLHNAEEEPSNVFFFPLLIRSLRTELNTAGTIIAIIFISLFFAPAITLYFAVGSFIVLLYLLGKGFVKLFKRRNT